MQSPVKFLLFLLASFCLVSSIEAEAWRLSVIFAVLTFALFPSATNN